MKCIPTIDIRRPIRTALAVLAIAALPAGAVAVPAFAGPSTASAVTTAAACATGWGSLPEASTFQGSGHLTGLSRVGGGWSSFTAFERAESRS